MLLVLAPRFVSEVGESGLGDTVHSGAVGLAALLLVPVLLVLLAVTLVGIPLAVLGGVAYGLLLWVGLVLGAYVLGTRALDRDRVEYARLLALGVGLLVVALTRFVPGGGLVRLALTVVGAGAVLLVLRARRVGDDGADELGGADGESRNRPAV